MRKIKVLIWEGLHFPQDVMGADLVVHRDPSEGIGKLWISAINKEIIPDMEYKIFQDETQSMWSYDEFPTEKDEVMVKEELAKVFSVSYAESRMTAQFISGGRVTSSFGGGSLN